MIPSATHITEDAALQEHAAEAECAVLDLDRELPAFALDLIDVHVAELVVEQCPELVERLVRLAVQSQDAVAVAEPGLEPERPRHRDDLGAELHHRDPAAVRRLGPADRVHEVGELEQEGEDAEARDRETCPAAARRRAHEPGQPRNRRRNSRTPRPRAQLTGNQSPRRA